MTACLTLVRTEEHVRMESTVTRVPVERATLAVTVRQVCYTLLFLIEELLCQSEIMTRGITIFLMNQNAFG